jgi:multiple sugar transport system permease protein
MVIGELGKGPLAHGSMSLMLLSYQYAFIDFEQARGAAVSVVLTVIILAFTVLYFVVTKKLNKGEN